MIFKQVDKPNSSFLTGVFIIVAALPLLAGLAYIIAPSDLIVFQWLGLVLPVLLLLNASVLVLSLILGNCNRILCLLILVSWICYVPLMFQLGINKEKVEGDLLVCSYNVKGMRSDFGFSTLADIVELSKTQDFDILCLQEVPVEYTSSRLSEEFDQMDYVIINDSVSSGANRLAILSKYPLKRKETLSNYDRAYAMLADVSIKGSDITLVNCHLQTTSWNQIRGAKNILSSRNLDAFYGNGLERERQVLAIQKITDNSLLPLIVVGDFNEPPVSYSYHALKSNRKDAFREAGSGYGNTYRYFSKLFRIDYIFYDKNKFEAVDYQALKVDYSDHLPVVADLIIKK